MCESHKHIDIVVAEGRDNSEVIVIPETHITLGPDLYNMGFANFMNNVDN